MAEVEIPPVEAEESPPTEDHRCRRSDGRRWRCKRLALAGFPHCEHHLSPAQRRRLLSDQPPPHPPHSPTPISPDHRLHRDLFSMPIPKKKRLPRIPQIPLRVSKIPAFPANPPPESSETTVEEGKWPKDSTFPANPPPEPSKTTVKEGKKSKDSTFEAIPDHLRCRRTDGRQWRCRRRSVDNHYYCELHSIQAFRRQHRLGVPDSLKLRRGRSPATKKRKRREEENKDEEEEKKDVKDNKRRGTRNRRGGERKLTEIVGMVMRRRRKNESAKVKISKEAEVPDHLRCRRTDGKRWRCSHRALDNLCFCEVHHVQAYRRQYKLGVPESLKLKRKPRGNTHNARRITRAIGKKRGVLMRGEELRRAVKMEKRRKGDDELLVEVMRMVLERQVERRRREEERRMEERASSMPEFVKKVLPNGVMTITPAGNSLDVVGRHLDMKIGLDSSSFLRWCFRSKNVDAPPVGSLQRLPYARKAMGLGKRRRHVCHHCRISPVGRILRCSQCSKGFFCRSCIKKWYSELSESDVRTACPICRSKCHCTACASSKPKDQSSQTCA